MHGVLDRVLLIYDAAIRRLSANEDFDPAVISDSAKLVQDFIENYHEKSEEDFLFPRFRQAHQLVDLVTTMLEQHQAGREVTRNILNSAAQVRSDAAAKRNCIGSMQAVADVLPGLHVERFVGSDVVHLTSASWNSLE
jgi:hemerythrin-like domain-containing protein